MLIFLIHPSETAIPTRATTQTTQQMLLADKRVLALFLQSQLMEKRPPDEQHRPDAANLAISLRPSKPNYCKRKDEAVDEEGGTILRGAIIKTGVVSRGEINDEGSDRHNGGTVVENKVAARKEQGVAPREEKTGIQPGKTPTMTTTTKNNDSSPSKRAVGALQKNSIRRGRLLPEDFKPTPYSVIIGGRGKRSKDHAIGNHRLRVLVSQHLPQYSNAVNRSTMSKIVSSVVTQVREACSKDLQEGGGTSSCGAFIKLGKDDGRWYEVSDTVAREKVGYTFRDMLGDRYRSSSQFKVARKRQLRGEREEEESCRGHQEQQDEHQQELPNNPKGGDKQTGQNEAVLATRNPSGEEQDAALLQRGEESSSTRNWPQSISPHQIPPPGFILLDGANTPRDFFGTSSSGSSSITSTTTSHAKEDTEARSHDESHTCHHHQKKRQHSHMTTTNRATKTKSKQLEEVCSSYGKTSAIVGRDQSEVLNSTSLGDMTNFAGSGSGSDSISSPSTGDQA